MKQDAINLDRFCDRSKCVHPLWWHLWKCTKEHGKLWEVGVCKGDCKCVGFVVSATPKMVNV